MGAVVSLRPTSRDEHLSGKAHCAACRHGWVAVAPVGADWLECPQCHLMKGRFLHPAIPVEGTDVWVCACGCDVFMVSRACVYCINCGTEQRF